MPESIMHYLHHIAAYPYMAVISMIIGLFLGQIILAVIRHVDEMHQLNHQNREPGS